MANQYVSTGSTSLGGTAGGAGLVQVAYDRYIEYQLRAMPLIRAVADKRPGAQSIPGSTVVLQRWVDLTPNTSALSETVDPDAIPMTTPTSSVITIQEFGAAVVVTRAVEVFSLADVDAGVGDIVAFNMVDSIETVAQAVLAGGTNVLRAGGRVSTVTLTSSDTFTSALSAKTTALLRGNKAIAKKGPLFWAGQHPHVAHDLRRETGVGSWRQPHEYAGNDAIWAGETGAYEGAFYVESARISSAKTGATQTAYATVTATSAVGAGVQVIPLSSVTSFVVGDQISGTGLGASSKITAINGLNVTVDVATVGILINAVITVTPVTRVFFTYFAGKQALAEAFAEEPHVVIGPVVDKLMRLRPIGWKAMGGFALYRQEALYRVETTSSIQYV